MEKKAASSGNRQEERRQRLLAVSKALHAFVVVGVKLIQSLLGHKLTCHGERILVSVVLDCCKQLKFVIFFGHGY